jgi:tRNA1(Val) A37 N6-methylase TrmN6
MVEALKFQVTDGTRVHQWRSIETMASCHCEATNRHFTPARAQDELTHYRRRGPTGTARLILQCLGEMELSVETLLDVGAGVGVLHHELLKARVQRAVHVEAAAAYVEAAREESVRRGHSPRLQFIHGDLVELATTLPMADLVTLDRVVCCYPDLDALVQQSAAKARRYYALSFPLDRWYMRAHTWWQNDRRRRAGNVFRTFVHPAGRIRGLIQASGFDVLHSRRTLAWQVLVCSRGSDG